MKITARGLTDVGKKRDHNEDAFLVDEALGLFIVADGMGGHAGGATASRLAVTTIREEVRKARERDAAPFVKPLPVEQSPVADVLRRAIETACAGIFTAAQRDPGLTGMGTTVTAALLGGGSAFVGHVGDSRCYLARGGRIHQVSEDHSLVNEQLKAGAITLDEARHSRFRNIITRSVGFEREVQVDVLGLDLAVGDVLLVCCDGLSNLVEDDELLAIVQQTPVDEAPQKLIDLANARGGEDNVTAVVVRIE